MHVGFYIEVTLCRSSGDMDIETLASNPQESSAARGKRWRKKEQDAPEDKRLDGASIPPNALRRAQARDAKHC